MAETNMPFDLEAIHDFATSLCMRAGSALRANALHRAQSGYLSASSAGVGPSRATDAAVADTLNIQDKDSNVDIVTDVDIAVEKLILDAIRERWPEHKLLAEESYAAGGSKRFELDDVSGLYAQARLYAP